MGTIEEKFQRLLNENEAMRKSGITSYQKLRILRFHLMVQIHRNRRWEKKRLVSTQDVKNWLDVIRAEFTEI